MNSIKYLAIFLGAVIITSEAEACSVCRSGENTFLFSERSANLTGQTADYHWWLNFDNLYSTKSNALSETEGGGSERQREIRPSMRLVYNLSQSLSFSAMAPVQFRRIRTISSRAASNETAGGIGDAELTAVWMHNIVRNEGQFYNGGFSFGLKMPTGRNKLQRAGERMDEHLQPGTGAWDWQIGLALARVTCSSVIFTSAYYRINGTNNFHYHYGNAWLVNFGTQKDLISRLTGSLQLNGRYSNRDRDDQILANNTGGTLLYLSPGLHLNLAGSAGISMALQIPVYHKLFGNQKENPVLSTGLGFQF